MMMTMLMMMLTGVDATWRCRQGKCQDWLHQHVGVGVASWLDADRGFVSILSITDKYCVHDKPDL